MARGGARACFIDIFCAKSYDVTYVDDVTFVDMHEMTLHSSTTINCRPRGLQRLPGHLRAFCCGGTSAGKASLASHNEG